MRGRHSHSEMLKNLKVKKKKRDTPILHKSLRESSATVAIVEHMKIPPSFHLQVAGPKLENPYWLYSHTHPLHHPPASKR